MRAASTKLPSLWTTGTAPVTWQKVHIDFKTKHHLYQTLLAKCSAWHSAKVCKMRSKFKKQPTLKKQHKQGKIGITQIGKQKGTSREDPRDVE